MRQVTPRRTGIVVGTLVSLGLIVASLLHLAPLDITEVLGFVTGGLCVWLTVEENIWNWPIGIGNSAFFLLLFWQSALYADMSLQAVYIVLGFLGWYWWLRGGEKQVGVTISRMTPVHAAVLAIIGVSATWGMVAFLRSTNDVAPFWDALTTVLSLIAQYMLTRKLLENWATWMTADVIYIGLYASRHLVLTSLLYVVFLSMCIAGLVQWRRSIAAARMPAAPALEIPVGAHSA